MTNKVYRSAQGKMVDLGTIKLQNEHVRAVGNMKVNARGDKVDGLNQVIETRTERIQRQNERTSHNVATSAPRTGSKKPSQSPQSRQQAETQIQSRGHADQINPDPVLEIDPVPVPPPTPSAPPVEQRKAPEPQMAPKPQVVPAQPARAPEVDLKNPARPAKSPVAETAAPPTQGGGLAGAIARSREIKQELDRTRRQKAQDSGLRKI